MPAASEIDGLNQIVSQLQIYFAPATANFNRPANTTAYAVGQLIANSQVAGSVQPLMLAAARTIDRAISIGRLSLKVNDAAWLNATIRVHLYKDSPTCTNGDGGAWLTTDSNYIGYSDVVLDRSFSDPFVKGFGIPSVGSSFDTLPSLGTQNIFALLEARSAVTSGSGKAFSLTVESYQAL